MPMQPLLHDLMVAVMAPIQAWSERDGQVRAHGAQGFYQSDRRILSRAELSVAGHEPETIASGPAGRGCVEIVSLLRPVDEPAPDPTVRLLRRRRLTSDSVFETLSISAATESTVTVPLRLALGCDLAAMDAVKAGARSVPAQPALRAGRTGPPCPVCAEGAGPTTTLAWQRDGMAVWLCAPAASPDLTEPDAPALTWTLTIEPGATLEVGWRLHAAGVPSPVLAGPEHPVWSTPTVTADDRRLPLLLRQSLEDLHALTMRSRAAPDEVFLAAGAPWFLTLFGRDSIWAARMMLPLGTDLAGGTLRTLAATQGVQEDLETGEQPGKILHEVRSDELTVSEGTVLPPVYYGTVDATPLWVCLLHDAWRWGMPHEQVRELLPAMEAALEWLVDYGDADGDGFLEYLDVTGRGLANQGWKDSGDAVQFRDGTLARGPIALCEVQGYAYEAALAGAALLDAFDRPSAQRWRSWAATMRERFRSRFWIEDEGGRYPAIALDANKRPVDTLTSNIGHLLGTGLLDPDEEAVVGARLASPTMDSGYGLRTMSSDSEGYWPLRYHGGTVWPHDTAIAISGLTRSGQHELAMSLAEGLLAAATQLDYRLPELYAGDARGDFPMVLPYPAACRPQAWSAATAVVLLQSALGLLPDAPAGRLDLRPAVPAPFGALRVEGLRLAGSPLSVHMDATGRVVHVEAAAEVDHP